MSGEPRWSAVDRWFGGLLVPEDEALAAAAASDVPAMEVSPAQGKLLWLLARAVGARAILELGTLAGYSTIWLARALPPDGRLVTLELDPRHAELARANLARAGVGHLVDVRVGPALDTLPGLRPAAPFDLVFLDADKERSGEYLAWALELSRPGTLIAADNVVRGGAVAEPESADPRVDGVRRLAELIAAEPRLEATAIQTVGVKGWDGFVLALVL